MFIKEHNITDRGDPVDTVLAGYRRLLMSYRKLKSGSEATVLLGDHVHVYDSENGVDEEPWLTFPEENVEKLEIMCTLYCTCGVGIRVPRVTARGYGIDHVPSNSGHVHVYDSENGCGHLRGYRGGQMICLKCACGSQRYYSAVGY